MNNTSPLRTLRSCTHHFRYIALAVSSFSFLFLAMTIFIGEQRQAHPEFTSLFYVGILLGSIQIPFSIYVWRYIPVRMPPVRDEKIIISGFRMTMLAGLLLCAGIVLFAGIASVMTGYAYPSAILGGLALGAMVYHLPGERTYVLYLRGLTGK